MTPKTMSSGRHWVCLCIYPYHINQLGDLESKAYFNSVISTLNWPHPALVALEKVLQQSVLHLRQGYKLTLSCKNNHHIDTQVKFTSTVLSHNDGYELKQHE